MSPGTRWFHRPVDIQEQHGRAWRGRVYISSKLPDNGEAAGPWTTPLAGETAAAERQSWTHFGCTGHGGNPLSSLGGVLVSHAGKKGLVLGEQFPSGLGAPVGLPLACP